MWKLSITFCVLFFIVTVSVGMAEVSPTVYLYDSNTPLEIIDSNSTEAQYRDIMVGTRLSIVISSDSNEYWEGGLFIKDPYRDYGTLFGRDYNDTTYDWEGSHFEAAGEDAEVKDWQSDIPPMSGFDLYSDSSGRSAGDWFIIDYNSIEPNTCRVGFYDHSVSWIEPVYEIILNQVKTRDFNGDTIVNLKDFAVLVSHWQRSSCSSPDWCEGADLNEDGNVTIDDLKAFVRFWLEQTE